MKKLIPIVLAAVCIAMTGCQTTKTESLREVTNIDGSTVLVPYKAERIAAVYGPSYEAMVVLGVEDKIVVRADVQTDNFPWALKIFSKIEKTSYLDNVHSSINTEELLTYSPDLVFTFPRPNELKQLEKMKVSAVPGATTDKLEDVKNQLMVYGEALGGDAVTAAKEYADYFDEKMSMVASVTDSIPLEQRPGVYYAGTDILTTYGKYSDIIELIQTAGGNPVSGDLEAGNRTQINFEQLAGWNPEYIFIDHGGMNDSKTVEAILNDTYLDGRYQSIKAVSEKEIYLAPSGVFYWDMGLQKILLLMYMAKTIHPEEFSSLDMTAEVQLFYEKFYHYSLTEEEAIKILNREDP